MQQLLVSKIKKEAAASIVMHNESIFANMVESMRSWQEAVLSAASSEEMECQRAFFEVQEIAVAHAQKMGFGFEIDKETCDKTLAQPQ
jgi:hypothetical protein